MRGIHANIDLLYKVTKTPKYELIRIKFYF